MQVSSSVSSGYYTPYQTNKSEKYPAGFNKTEEGNMTFNEETENSGFAPNLPEEFAEMSFWDLISSGKGNEIPTVDKIVNAKNPVDGKIYLTFFTEDKISCCEPGGEKVWELEISNVDQKRRIMDFFEKYAPDRDCVKEYYSEDSLGIVSSKKFWMGYLGNDFIMKASEEVQEETESSLKEKQVVFAGAIGSANQYFMYADEAGIIDYNGIIFYCDTETDTLMLGDCSNVSKCIRISLTDGGFLMVNRDNLDQLFDALPFFSPEDMIKILQVLQQEKMADDSIVGMVQEEDKILEMAEGEKQIKRSLEEVPNYSEYLKKKIDEIFVKIQNGDTEPSYQIGSQSFTEKEWETFLEKFDSIEEAIQELIKEEQARKEAEETNQENELAGTVSAGNGIPGNHGLETWYQGEKVECASGVRN